jgi:DNA modification methylase
MAVVIYNGNSLDVLRRLPVESVQCCVTSPPYWGLRDYGNSDQLGLEKTPEQYVANLVAVFQEVHRVLRKDGALWLNIGDSYNGSGGAGGDYGPGGIKEGQPRYPGRNIAALKPKDLVGIPWRVAFALQECGWYLRQDIIWHKPNPMPESVRGRCTKAHEYVFLLSKSARYFWDQDALAEKAATTGDNRAARADNTQEFGRGGDDSRKRTGAPTGATRNRRSVWTITTKPYSEAHFATFPPELPRLCIMAGSKKGDTVLDPFFGAGTTGLVADQLGRDCIGIELNREYALLAKNRIMAGGRLFSDVSLVHMEDQAGALP